MLKTETHNCFISQKSFIRPAKALLQLKEQQRVGQGKVPASATAVAVAAAAASAAGNRSLCNVRA